MVAIVGNESSELCSLFFSAFGDSTKMVVGLVSLGVSWPVAAVLSQRAT